MEKIITIVPDDLAEMIRPMLSKEFKEVVTIANKLKNAEILSLKELRDTVMKLAGYLTYAGTVAGHFSATRRTNEAEAFINATGTDGMRRAVARWASKEERQKEEVFNNLFKSINWQIDASKKCWEIKQTEWNKANNV